MFRNFPYACRLCKSFLNLEKDGFNYSFDKQNGTAFLLCFPCKNDLERVARGELSREKFSNLVKERWEKEMSKINQKIEEAKRQGFEVETITGSRSAETISCCQLVKWFSSLEEEKRKPQRSSFLIILDNLKKKGKLCSNCSEFCNNLWKENSSNG